MGNQNDERWSRGKTTNALSVAPRAKIHARTVRSPALSIASLGCLRSPLSDRIGRCFVQRKDGVQPRRRQRSSAALQSRADVSSTSKYEKFGLTEFSLKFRQQREF